VCVRPASAFRERLLYVRTQVSCRRLDHAKLLQVVADPVLVAVLVAEYGREITRRQVQRRQRLPIPCECAASVVHGFVEGAFASVRVDGARWPGLELLDTRQELEQPSGPLDQWIADNDVLLKARVTH
jgi:hypothetical protein